MGATTQVARGLLRAHLHIFSARKSSGSCSDAQCDSSPALSIGDVLKRDNNGSQQSGSPSVLKLQEQQEALLCVSPTPRSSSSPRICPGAPCRPRAFASRRVTEGVRIRFGGPAYSGVLRRRYNRI